MACTKVASRSLGRMALPQRRTFINTGSSIQSLTATRTVPYGPGLVYGIISDISAYSKFLPFCKSSEVTAWSEPDKQSGKRWPSQATLTIGFNNDISESFTSRVYCVPDKTVEALSGPDIESALDPEAIAHHPATQSSDDPSRSGSILTHLRTTWSLHHVPFKPGPLRHEANPVEETADVPAQHHTEVRLGIEYAFANPIYAAMSRAAAPKVAEYMVEAFEKRCEEMLRKPSSGGPNKSRVVKG